MTNKQINLAIVQLQIGKYSCARCDKPATVVKYGCAFCGEFCAEAAGDFTLEGGAAMIPDYAGDLNAMHELESTLSNHEKLLYYQELVDIFDRNPDGSHRFGSVVYWETLHASAVKRAQAYLTIFGKWQQS